MGGNLEGAEFRKGHFGQFCWSVKAVEDLMMCRQSRRRSTGETGRVPEKLRIRITSFPSLPIRLRIVVVEARIPPGWVEAPTTRLSGHRRRWRRDFRQNQTRTFPVERNPAIFGGGGCCRRRLGTEWRWGCCHYRRRRRRRRGWRLKWKDLGSAVCREQRWVHCCCCYQGCLLSTYYY